MFSRIDGKCFSHTAILCLPEAISYSSGRSARTTGELPDHGVAGGGARKLYDAGGGRRLYDVFLSFRGVVRNNFAVHLHAALRNAGVDVFLDDAELAIGENISHELVRSIEGSRIAIVVLSEHYAESTWCLQELEKIMQCQGTLNQVVIPVFYGVDPSDVRKQSGSFAWAFESHEVRFKYDLDKVLRWRLALTMAADLTGWDVRGRNEAQVIGAIVDDILRRLACSTDLFVARYPVGVESRVRELRSLLKVESYDEVCMLGIWGMGGMGKTTIAKAIYNELRSEFSNKRSFLANIREAGDKPDRLVHLQEQLLGDVLITKSKMEVGSVARGIELIKSRLHNQKVLIIFDDVDHMSQLDALAGSRNWFGLGSRIIVTTRNRKLLQDLEVDSTYSAPEMNDVESLELFSLHAFRQRKPPAKFSGLSRTVVDYCKGLPLALEVLGSFLSGRAGSEWKRVLEKLTLIPDNNIQEKLRISFDGLDIKVKSIFLDIACFFIGMDKDYVFQILEGCDLYPEIGLLLLLERCLVTVNERNKLMMHDLIRDMGRAIVREKSDYRLGKQSRLWCNEDVTSVLTKETVRTFLNNLFGYLQVIKGKNNDIYSYILLKFVCFWRI